MSQIDDVTRALQTAASMRYYAPTQIGTTQRLTEQGFLLCEGVPIGRTGEMLYGPGEVPVAPGADGMARVSRTPDVVFADVAIASLNGAPITIGHPVDGVKADNVKQLEVGTVLNPRRGIGAQAHLLIGDMLIKDPVAIEGVRSKAYKDVSAGYVADYRDLGSGRGVQSGIRHNHVALVTPGNRGRCGGECAIGDQDPAMTDTTVTKDQPSLGDQIVSLLLGKRSAETQTADTATITKDEFAKLTKDVGDLTKAVGILAKKFTKDAEKDEWGEDPDDKSDEADARRKKAKAEGKTGDMAALGVKLGEVRSRAEILSPGVKLAALTGDDAASPAKTADHICSCQRQTLGAAWTNEKGRDAIKPFVTGDAPDFTKLTPAAIELAFMGASEIMRQANNAATAAAVAGAARTLTGDDEGRFKPGSMAAQLDEMNRAAAEGWAKRANGSAGH